MEWKNLSDKAKGILEWVENPFTKKRETIEIKIGSVFYRKYHKLCGDFGEPLSDTNILVTEELYQEILNYVIESEDIQCEQFTGGLIFRLKDGVEI